MSDYQEKYIKNDEIVNEMIFVAIDAEKRIGKLKNYKKFLIIHILFMLYAIYSSIALAFKWIRFDVSISAIIFFIGSLILLNILVKALSEISRENETILSEVLKSLNSRNESEL